MWLTSLCLLCAIHCCWWSLVSKSGWGRTCGVWGRDVLHWLSWVLGKEAHASDGEWWARVRGQVVVLSRGTHCGCGGGGWLAGVGVRGNVCPARYFSINYPDFSPRFTLSWISPPSRPRCTAHLPYKAHCTIQQYL